MRTNGCDRLGTRPRPDLGRSVGEKHKGVCVCEDDARLGENVNFAFCYVQ